MMREYHVRFCERLEGKFLRPTRLEIIDLPQIHLDERTITSVQFLREISLPLGQFYLNVKNPADLPGQDS